MKTLQLPGQPVRVYADLGEIPIKNYIEYCKFQNLYYLVGSGQHDKQRHEFYINLYTEHNLPEFAHIQRKNMEQLQANIEAGYNYAVFAVICLFESQRDLSDDGILETFQQIGEHTEQVEQFYYELADGISQQVIRKGFTPGRYNASLGKFISSDQEADFLTRVRTLNGSIDNIIKTGQFDTGYEKLLTRQVQPEYAYKAEDQVPANFRGWLRAVEKNGGNPATMTALDFFEWQKDLIEQNKAQNNGRA